ncbi:hypothetical protein C9F11_43765 (plasmid) [Streptomyces sp. YIM 121038]|uniref:hypothetical protein n=1 Tax=Streptomyces sp. YIM 121038 TaxID=2136401 RepID=UPI001110C485|nr:hypothetical protein [Streptomyces sp. YIM 121038]QCX82331.1 hypothetical protein C9F11_43765 [Streptomyces sp. YIM 121038]
MHWSLISIVAYTLTALVTAVTRTAGHSRDTAMIPVTVPELLRWLRLTALPAPVRSLEHLLHWTA